MSLLTAWTSERYVFGPVQMKRRSALRLCFRPNSPVFVALVVLAIAGTLHTGCTSRVAPRPASTLQPAQTVRQTGTLPSSSPAARLVCPTLGSSTVTTTLPEKGGHRVILSWRASAPADSKHSAAVGYCVYRGMKPKDPSPELVNSIPFPGTSCTDDSVENAKKYYYVVRAIGAKGTTSISSNETHVAIPSKQSTSFSGASVPQCREPASK
jgi:hypothetical protein